ncbi:ATP-binding protein [Kineococcus rhizosphaerae]|uniref:ATPase family protein associated with various cellular activities (AAA) n=1 Tax=Kineococcus rhizosphaerae TaxID=559628 RepID=A0A2T0QYG3_9ACTN|nr:ATP-binding protein [Kineococcus rhizosphaerae]PRY11424.1 ATPase family protein associated with various cellular activities (AAA) [Kineococcus rhizosphaerae]
MEGRLLATAAHVRALVESHTSGDDARFRAAVAELLEAAGRRGDRVREVEELRGLLETRRASVRPQAPAQPTLPASVAQPRGELAQVLTVALPRLSLADLALGSDVMARLHRVLTEQRHAETLRARGFQPLRKLLLTGQSGTGKSMTAEVLAAELALPVLTVRLDVFADLPAEDAVAKLSLVFDLLAQSRGVCLFDDVDALIDPDGGERSRTRLRDVLRAFTGFLDADTSTGVLVVTTNRPQLLDRPVLRRFDTVVDYPLPSTGVVQEVVLRRLRGFDLSGVEWPRVASTASGLSHEQVSAAAALAAKQSILDGAAQVETGALLAALRERRQMLKMAP